MHSGAEHLLSECLSVRMYQRDSNWTDFLEIWYGGLILKIFKKI